MDYHASDSGETINQHTLQISDGSVIYGGKGNDTITFGNVNVLGGAGSDTFIFDGSWGAVVYWDAPSGVRVDLAKGTAQDGFGFTDTLVNVMNVQGSGHDDVLIGNSGNNSFFGVGGNDTVIGGGGSDTMSYYQARASDAVVSYDAASDTFTVVKHFANGDQGTDHLTGISKISFVGDASDHVTLTRNNFVAVDGFMRMTQEVALNLPAGAGLSQLKTGDFNGDGHADWMLVTQIGTGTAAAPTYFFLGSGDGHFSDASALLAPAGVSAINGGGRTLVADFNNDGRADVVQFNFGDDAPPFPGGINSLWLSSAASGTLTDQSATLSQTPQQNHAGSAGDVNGDGYLDLLVNTLSAGNQLYLNNGNGQFTLRPDLLPHDTTMLGNVAYPTTNTQSAILDVNGDGHADLILGKWDSTSSTPSTEVLLNDGNGNFAHSVPIALPASGIPNEIVLDIKAIDLNHDGLPDLMLSVTNGGARDVFYQTAHIELLVNDGNGQFHDETDLRIAPALQKALGSGGWIMSLSDVDMNHDGQDDILVTSASDSVPSVLLMNQGDGTFAAGWNSGSNGRTVALDANGDGMSDLLTYFTDSNTAVVDLNVMSNGHVYKAGPGATSLAGSAGNDRLISSDAWSGAQPDETIDGGAGLDTVVYNGARASYTVSAGAGGFAVHDNRSGGGSDWLHNVERLSFADGALALDVDGVAGQAYRIYQAAFDRAPDAAGLGYWINAMDHGATLSQVASGFTGSGEFQALYGVNPSHADVINRFYQNVLHRPAEQAGFDYWLGQLDAHPGALADILASFSESPENQAALVGVTGHGIAYLPYH